ncbi:MAG: hypothetical protein VYA53_03490 [Acidobacteriota bacterium]|nr:hypothetical protein [Acidobacteriota bacterium]
MVRTCLDVFSHGTEEQLYEILPHVSILRSPLFLKPLLSLLKSGKVYQQEFAAVALGSVGDSQAIKPLTDVFMKSISAHRDDVRSLQASIVQSLGDIGNEQAIQPLLRIYKLRVGSGRLSSCRQSWVLAALGNLAQQGGMRAVRELTTCMRTESELLRAQAVAEMAMAFWHRPAEVPEEVLEDMYMMTADRSEGVRAAALSALSDLAKLGVVETDRSLPPAPFSIS